MNHKETIAFVMQIFNEEYPGKFIKPTSRMRIWEQILNGFDSEVILTAAYHLASTRKDWAPDIATMREQCVLMSHGELHNPTGAESWERIRQKMTDKPELELSNMEKKALAQTSSIYDLRRSLNGPTDRAHYIKAFDGLVQKRHMDRITLPEVKAMTARNAPALPAHETPKPAELTEGTQIINFVEAREEFIDLVSALEARLGIDRGSE